MKITKICIFTIVAFAAYACAKSDSVDTSSVTPETLVPVENDEIQCINGTLHFSSGEVCLNTLESLTSEESLHAFEKAHNFPRGVRSRIVCWMILSPVKLRRSTKRFLKPAQAILKWIMTA